MPQTNATGSKIVSAMAFLMATWILTLSLLLISDTSEDQALSHQLRPLQCWVNLTPGNTYLHGTFDFATMAAKLVTVLIKRHGMH